MSFPVRVMNTPGERIILVGRLGPPPFLMVGFSRNRIRLSLWWRR